MKTQSSKQPWLFPSLRGYRRDWLRGDVLAGLTVWAVLVPEALAYASIAGVSPVVGLYAAPSGEDISKARVYPSVRAAVDAARPGEPPSDMPHFRA